ncbi:hypothetical protein [Aquirufa aurantiipilula]|uniref:hypothetical protein n=1 Tax=Aquirufa aurantiipilula TaxID=2696561 RepID=UPI001CAA41F5|nr:hypothetical protein [Aquirufa aurantiipilula]MBZ1325583.1 hypothetical protein [Aquirufa aurantiipilula]
MIRARIIKNVNDILDKHQYFDSNDFVITTKKEYSGTELKIVYNLDNRYELSIRVPDEAKEDGSYEFSGTLSPGPLSFQEKIKFNKESVLYTKITLWMDCIWSELCSDPVVKEIDKQREDINKILETLSDVPDEYFSKEEVSTLTERLNKLEEELKSQIEHNTKNKKDLEKQIEDLIGDIENLKVTLNSTKKAGWRKNFVTKVYKWVKDPNNRKIIGDGFEIAKGLLPNEYKGYLPEKID